jgi:hypothetical protein
MALWSSRLPLEVALTMMGAGLCSRYPGQPWLVRLAAIVVDDVESAVVAVLGTDVLHPTSSVPGAADDTFET